jgi:hypothetical protein
MVLKMFQHFDDLRTFHAPTEMAFVNLARQRQADSRGKSAAFIFHTTQNRSLAARCPGSSEGFLKGEPKFVKKHDFCVVSPRFF